MKIKNLLVSLSLSLGLVAVALSAQGGPGNGRGSSHPDTPPVANPEACPYLVDGACPGCPVASPEECPKAVDGVCPERPGDPNLEGPACPLNPDGQPKRDGSGGPGKPANPAGPQDGTAPGQGHRGGRG